MSVPAVIARAADTLSAPATRQRAVVFVPGLKRQERNQQRNVLVENLLLNEEIPLRRSSSDGEEIRIAGATGVRLKTMSPRLSTEGAPTGAVDIFEAYWGDHVPVDAEQQPLRRMSRGLSLLCYWFASPIWRAFSAASYQIPLGLLIGGGALVLWYLSLAMTIAGQWVDPTSGLASQAAQLKSALPWLSDWLAEQIALVGAWRIWPLIALLLPVTPVMVIVDHAQAVRLLLTNALDEKGVGRRSRVRKAVGDVLASVAEARDDRGEPLYADITCVAHSFGTIVLMDVLADWPHASDFERLSVVTLGSPQSVLATRSTWLREETRRLLESRRVARWTDVSGDDDYMSAPIDGHQQAYGAPSLLTLRLEQGGLPFSTSAHDAYLASSEVLRLVLR